MSSAISTQPRSKVVYPDTDGEPMAENTLQFQMNGWTSPQLGVRFDMTQSELVIVGPDGRRFLTFSELVQQRNQLERQLDGERIRAQRLEEQLRSLGVEPSA